LADKEKIRWPTKKVMSQIYEKGFWGKKLSSKFYSGDGSHLSYITEPYLKAVTSFLKSFKTPLSICDLGCGDFNIGKEFVPFSNKYIGIDIVQSLIDYNTVNFIYPNLEFRCLDISKDVLPQADCAIVRQVLQHLSNKEIVNVLKKLSKYKYVILTEHLPVGNFTANKDVITSLGIRLKKQSGVVISLPPFNFKIVSEKQLSSVFLEDNKGVIVTTLYKTR